MAEFLRLYVTEDQCHADLVAMRWPKGFPRCRPEGDDFKVGQH